MRTVSVTLGGKAYTVQALPIRESAAWRKRLQGPFAELATMLEGAGTIALTNGRDLAGVMRALSDTLLGSIDLLLALLFDYSPALREDRERIEAECYDDEAVLAFAEVLKLAYPFGAIVTIFRGAKVG